MKKLSLHLKLLTLAIVGASLMACGNKDASSESGGGVVAQGIGVCSSCTGWGGQSSLFSGAGYGSTSFPIAMSIELVGDLAQVNSRNSLGMDPSKTYSGQTYLRQAAINVGSQLFATQCVIPAGTYTLTPTTNMGNYAGGSFVIPQFVLSNGSVSLVASLQQGAIVAPYVGGPAQGFGALLVVLAGPSKYMPHQTVSCNDNVGFQLAP